MKSDAKVLPAGKINWSNLVKFRELGLAIFIILLCVVINIRNDKFLTWVNISDMFLDTSILSFMALGMMLVIVTRGIDLSVASVLALSGMITGFIVIAFPHIHPAFTATIGLLLGIFFGSITGMIISKGGVPPIIATLGMMSVYRGITFIISGGRWVNAYQMPDSFRNMTRNTLFGINNMIVIAIIIYIIFYYFINHTRTGRWIFATGSSPEAARVSGIKIDRILLLVYMIMGGLSGLGGVLWVSRYASAQNDTAAGFELTVISACVLGGVNIAGGSGTVLGVLLGSILIGIINNALPMIRVSPFWKLAIQGLVIIIAVLVNVFIQRDIRRRNTLLRKI